jgi:hypothetical protein
VEPDACTLVDDQTPAVHAARAIDWPKRRASINACNRGYPSAATPHDRLAMALLDEVIGDEPRASRRPWPLTPQQDARAIRLARQ